MGVWWQGHHEIAVGYPMVTDGASFYSLKHLYEIPDSIKARLDGRNLAPDQDSNPIIISSDTKYRVWVRWGEVGEDPENRDVVVNSAC